LTRLATQGQYLWSWDSVNFALALTEIDVAQHQPHPPGYLGYVLLARGLELRATENLALLRAGLAGSTLTAALTWRFAERLYASRRAAWMAWALVVFSPLHWFYGSVAEIYAAETAVTVALAYAAYAIAQNDSAAPVLVAGAVFAGVLIKPTVALLMGPLLAYALWRGSVATRRRAGVAILVGGGAAIAALAATEPLAAIMASSGGQVSDVADSSFLADLNLHALNRSARDMVYAAVAALGAGGLVALATGRPSAAGAWPFMAMWVVGYLLTCLLVHFPKPGYLLPLLPIMALILSGSSGRLSRGGLLAAMAAVALLNTIQFTLIQPFPAAAVGAGMRYGDKSMAQQVRTEANSVLRPSAPSIRALDRLLSGFLGAVESRCGEGHRLVIVQAGGTITWRHAMFYLPDATVVQVPGRDAPLLVGEHHSVRPRASGGAPLKADCVVVLEGRTDADIDGRRAIRWADTALDDQTMAASATAVELHLDADRLRLVTR
jgi:hypothetical protein